MSKRSHGASAILLSDAWGREDVFTNEGKFVPSEPYRMRVWRVGDWYIGEITTRDGQSLTADAVDFSARPLVTEAAREGVAAFRAFWSAEAIGMITLVPAA